MKVSGFTIARNVVQADYPVKEAILSILPLVNEMIIAVGESTDSTMDYIQSFATDQCKIIPTIWDDNLRIGGKVLADETNKALNAVSSDSDWLFYIQGDECIHEQDYEKIKFSMQNNLHNPEINGLLFDYVHFYGSYDFVGDSRRWYKREIRIIRNNKNIISWGDAQGFKTKVNEKKFEKISVAHTGAKIYHYGWVKHPDFQQAKQMQFHRMWHDDNYMNQKVKADTFDYSGIDSLELFTASHPQIMLERISKMNWKFDFDVSKKNFNLKTRILYWIEKKFGWKIGEYKNYVWKKK